MDKIGSIFTGLEQFGNEPKKIARVCIRDAEKRFDECMIYLLKEFYNKDYVRLKEYDYVIQWLNDNEGKGLIMTGSNGRGKTLIGKYIIPAMYLNFANKVVTCCNAPDILDMLDVLKTKRFLSIDDIGTESMKKNTYGTITYPFAEIMDNAEKNHNIIIITTNLDANNIEKTYDKRTRERIKSCCMPVLFTGDSLR